MTAMEQDPKEYEDVLSEARTRFEGSVSDDGENRANYIEDLNYVYTPGSQWPDDIRAKRKAWGEECLEFNQLKQFVAQVVNDQLQNRPGIRSHPVSGDASEEVSEIIQGLIRSIENESSADAVYKNGFKLAVAGSRGWWRVVSEYESGDGFNQKLLIKPIQDSNSVYADLNYEQPDGSDRGWAFVVEKYSKDEFLKKWPKADAIDWQGLDVEWGGEDSIFVADYYRRVCKQRELVLMTDGAQGWKDEMPTPPEGIKIERSRMVDTWKVEWYTLAGGQQVLEKHDWPGSIIPVICTPGEDLILNGKRVYQSLTRHARDAQSMLNFGMTQQAIHLALTPRAPWVIAEGQIEGYEQMWKDANQKNYNALVYKPTTVDGLAVPPPQRTAPAMAGDGWERWTQQMLQMIKSTMGMYENTLGQRAGETSGRAIIAREKQGDVATFNYVHNWHNAIELTGWVLVECIPTFYDTERIVSIIGPDDTKKLVRVNQEMPNPDDPMQAIKSNDLTKGKYGITIDAGPSYATKRQETSEALMSLVQSFPPVAQVAGDLIVKSLAIADAEVISDRLKLTLPPVIQQAEAAKAEGRKPPDPQIMAQLQEKDQQLQQAAQTMQAMHEKVQELESGHAQKMAQLQAETQLKQQAAQMDVQANAEKAQADAELTLQKAQLDAQTKIEVARIDQQTKLMIADITKPEPEEPAEELDENGEPMPPKPDPMMMIAQTQAETANAIQELARAMSRPKQLIRGPDGKAIGVQ